MKYGFKTLQTNVSWDTLRAVWERGDELEVFDSAWLNDHFLAWREEGGYHEAMICAAALASRTQRLTIGHTVLGNTHRHPALLAKMAATLDHVAPGRFILGLGAGWNEAEHAMFGWDLPPLGKRISMLEESIQILKGMWANPDSFSFQGDFYQLTEARCDPPCITPGGPPIWLGTKGKQRGLKMLARWGDGWAATSDGWTPTEAGNLPEFRELLETLHRHCEDVGRDPAEIEVSVRFSTRGKTVEHLRQEVVAFAAAGARHLVFSVPAHEGPAVLSELARDVVEPLRAELG